MSESWKTRWNALSSWRPPTNFPHNTCPKASPRIPGCAGLPIFRKKASTLKPMSKIFKNVSWKRHFVEPRAFKSKRPNCEEEPTALSDITCKSPTSHLKDEILNSSHGWHGLRGDGHAIYIRAIRGDHRGN